MKNIFIALTLLGCSLTQAAHASVQAIPLPGDTRLVVFPFDAHNTYRLYTRIKNITNVEFHAEERIKAVALGDTVQWEVAKTGDGRHLFIKPKFENISTSATIITDKRTYQLLLESCTDEIPCKGPNGKKVTSWYQRVTWDYPELVIFEEQKRAEAEEREEKEEKRLNAQVLNSGIPLESVNFNYDINGDAPFKPVGVFDDGKFTYVRMPANTQELPAMFLKTADEELELINYVVKGEYLVVQRLVEGLLLKIGKREVTITNKHTAKTGVFSFFEN